jgi:SPP1 family predicted phage head-tail adaptor
MAIVAATYGAGDFDRRITVEVAAKARDASNDEVVRWDLVPAFKRWANKRDFQGGESMADQQIIRDADTVFTLRYDSESMAIAPETHRISYQGKMFKIVGTREGQGRLAGWELLCSSRPDATGARGRNAEWGP